MQFKGPLGPGGRGSVSELKSAAARCPMDLGNAGPRPGPSRSSQTPASPLPSAADHLEEELDLLLNLDAPVKVADNILPDQTLQKLESEKAGEVVQEEEGMVFILFPIHLLDSSVFVRKRGHIRTRFRWCLPSIWHYLLTSISVLTSLLSP